jgi:hypothetical protein
MWTKGPLKAAATFDHLGATQFVDSGRHRARTTCPASNGQETEQHPEAATGSIGPVVTDPCCQDELCWASPHSHTQHDVIPTRRIEEAICNDSNIHDPGIIVQQTERMDFRRRLVNRPEATPCSRVGNAGHRTTS